MVSFVHRPDDAVGRMPARSPASTAATARSNTVVMASFSPPWPANRSRGTAIVRTTRAHADSSLPTWSAGARRTRPEETPTRPTDETRDSPARGVRHRCPRTKLRHGPGTSLSQAGTAGATNSRSSTRAFNAAVTGAHDLGVLAEPRIATTRGTSAIGRTPARTQAECRTRQPPTANRWPTAESETAYEYMLRVFAHGVRAVQRTLKPP